MSGPKIKVSADVSGVNAAMNQTTKGMQQAEKAAKALEEQLKRTARAQAALAREGIKVTRAQAESAKNAFDSWKKSGARGTSKIRGTEFDDWAGGGWKNYSMDSAESLRHRNSVLGSIGVNGGGAGRQSFGSFIGNASSMAGRGIARSILPMGGIGGQIAAGGVDAAGSSAGGLMSGGGLARIAGGLGIGALAMGAFKMIQGVHAGMGRAEDESGTYSDLRRSLGVTSNDFNDLRTSVRHFSDGLGLAYNETAKLAAEYAKTAALRSGANLGQEVGSAAGFGRGFGLAPQATVQFMASMRHFGASGGDNDNRKLAVMIAESVSRGGTTSKMGEVLSALQSFTSMAARASLTAPNVGAYASFMSSMTGSNLVGMKGDPENAAAAMGAADSSLRHGGAFGQASRSFTLGMYQRQLKGFNALDMDYMGEQGAFGSVAGAFGKDSAAYSFAKSRGDNGLMGKYDSWSASGGQSVIAMQMQALEKAYGGNTDGFRNAIQSHLGVGSGQAGALYSAYKNDKGLGGLQSSLDGAGVDTSKMNTQTIAALAQLSGGDSSSIDKQALKLRGLTGSDRLSTRDVSDLDSASGNSENMRDVVLRLTSLHDVTKDDGTIMREQKATLDNLFQEIATKLIPITMLVKDGIIELVKVLPGTTDFEKRIATDANDAAAKGTLDGKVGPARMGAAQKLLADSVLNDTQYSADVFKMIRADAAGSGYENDGSMQTQSGKIRAAPRRSDNRDTKGPLNLRNNNPGNIRPGSFANRHGTTGSSGGFAVFPSAEAGTAAMDALLQSYSKKDGLNSVAGIVGKWAPSGDNNDVSAYASQVSKRMGVGANDKLNMSDPSVRQSLGREMARHEGSSSAYVVGGELTINDNRNMSGQRAPLVLNKRSSAPQPAGMRGISG